jgi:hypothetical protein
MTDAVSPSPTTKQLDPTKPLTVRPLSPGEVDDARAKSIPGEVIEIFNGLIAEKWNGVSATVDQGAAAQAIADKMGITTGVAFERGFLDIESIYRHAGWVVYYDKPGFNEDYLATFRFTRKGDDR